MADPGLAPALNGVRVLDMSTMVAGPYGASMLADFGADVIKVEPPAGDQSRHFGPRVETDSGIFVGVNRNKRGMVVDLTRPEGKQVYERLVRWADIVVDNNRPRAREQLGVSYEHTKAIKPDIIYISVTAYGADGPYAGRPGIDPLAQAITGFMSVCGEADGRPMRQPIPIADVACAYHLAFAALAALRVRDTQHVGQCVEVSLIDALVHCQPTMIGMYFLADYRLPRLGNAIPYYAPFDSYVCADGGSIVCGAYGDPWFQRLAGAMDRPELLADPRYATPEARLNNREALDKEISAWTGSLTRDEAVQRLVAADVMAAPIHDHDEAFADPQVRHNQMLVEVEHTKAGRVTVVGVAPKLLGTPGRVRTAAPSLGEHTDECLHELGYSDEQVAELTESGVTSGRTATPDARWARVGR